MKGDPSAARLLRILSYLPDGISSGSLENLSLFSVKEVYQASYTLRSVSLAYQDSNGTLRSLSPIRYHVATYTPLQPEELETIREYYLGLAALAEQAVNQEVDMKETVRILRPELGNLLSVLRELAVAPDVTKMTGGAILQTTKFMYLNSVPTTELLTLLLGNKNFKPFDLFKAESLYMIGMVHHICTRLNASLKAMKEAEILFASLKSARRLAACEWTEADLLRYQGRYLEAATMYESAKRSYESLDSSDDPQDGIALCLWGLASVAEVRGELAQARSMLNEAIKIASPDDISLHAICRMSLATVDMQQGKYREAVYALREILKECRITEDQHDFGQCIYRLCIALLYLGEHDQVKVYAEEGRLVGKAQSDHEVYGNCTRCLGYVRLHERAFGDAEAMFNQALSAFEESEDLRAIVDTKFAITKIMLEMGDKGKAESSLSELLSEYREIGYQKGTAEALVVLSKCYRQLPDHGDRASPCLREAAHIYGQLNNEVEVQACRSILDGI
jgi:tetratricopeptide (TPR) repeat protein